MATKKLLSLTILAIGYVIVFLIGGIYQSVRHNTVAYYATVLCRMHRKLQELPSPGSGRHVAALYKKNNLGDSNFIVKIDGNTVFVSSDYATFPDGQYRETLLWDKTGRVLVLELMGKRVFAIESDTGKKLKGSELLGIEFRPLPSDDDFYAPLRELSE